MKNYVKQIACLCVTITLLSFKPTFHLPPGITGDFINSYNQYSYDCEFPLEYVVCNNNSTTYNFLRVTFTGNGGGSYGVRVTGSSGGSNVRYINNNQVRLDLGPYECATINVNALRANTEQNVQAFLGQGEYAGAVNVVFANSTDPCP